MKNLLAFLPLLPLFAALLTPLSSFAAPAENGRPAAAAPSRRAEVAPPNFREGELLVKFRESTGEAGRSAVHRRLRSEVAREFRGLRLQRVKLPPGLAVGEALRRLRDDPAVEYAEPNFLVGALATPNDPLFNTLWALDNTGQSGGSVDADIDAPEAWNLVTGSADVVVGVIDSGIDTTHADLAGNLWSNPGEIAGNGLDDDGNGYVDDIHGINAITGSGSPMDDHGHGTHVAGTIGAVGNNGVGLTGVAWDVALAGCKFLGASGSGAVSDAIECLTYFAALKDAGVNLVATNNSWGGGSYSQALADAIAQQRDRGILFVAAAGNASSDNDLEPAYPAGYRLPNIVAVAATDGNDSAASFSNLGRRSVHLAAPGVGIASTLPPTNYYNIGGGYGSLSGTSMAAPHVSGLAALLKAQDPGRDWRDLRALLLAGGDDVGALAAATISGRRANAFGSLSCVGGDFLSVLDYPLQPTIGAPARLSAFSLDCAGGSGPVTVSTSEAESISLLDDGLGDDQAAGDGVFTGSWTPARTPERLVFTSPAGSETIVLPALAVGHFLPAANPGVPYSQPLAAAGGKPPYAWSIADGALPAGFSLDAVTGTLSGTAAVTGATSFTAAVGDAWGESAQRQLFLRTGDSPVREDWTAQVLSHKHDYGRGVAVDTAGNVYVVGELNNGNDLDLIVVKYDAGGHEVWRCTVDGGTDERGYGIAVSAAGEVFAVGSSGRWETVSRDHLIVKIGATGALAWSQVLDRGGDDVAWAAAVDPAGNLLVSGEKDNAAGDKDVVTAKFDAAGSELWARAYDGFYNDMGYAVTADAAGNVHVGGTQSRLLSHHSSAQTYDFLLVKYDAAGTYLLSRTVDTGSHYDALSGIGTDAAGNVYVAGSDDYAQYRYVTLKYNNANTLVWYRFHDAANGFANGIAVDSAGRSYVTGSVDNGGNTDIRTLQYDTDGNLIWTHTTDSGFDDEAHGIALTPDGGLVVAGRSHNGHDYDIVAVRYGKSAPSMTATAPPAGTWNLAYSHTLGVSGGFSPYTWAVSAGTLPDGLSLDAGSGKIAGTPLLAGSYPFTVTVTDADGQSASAALTIAIATGLSVDFAATPLVGTAPLPVAFTDATGGGATAWSWSFGDGGTSGTQHPAYFYRTPGTYAVQLTASHAGGSETLLRNDYITVQACPNGPVRRTGSVTADYADIATAYAAAADGDALLLQSLAFTGSVVFDRPLSIAVGGGYLCDFGSRHQKTLMHGAMKIQAGRINIENLTLR